MNYAINRIVCRLVAIVAIALVATPRLASATDPANPRTVLREAQSRVVKLFGAGGIRGLEAYQTGLIVSAEGHVVTVNSSVLDTGDVTVVTIDGARRTGEVLAADPIADAALLKFDPAGEPPPFWDLSVTPSVAPGDPVWVLANEFGIATGNESVTVLHGVVAARAPLRGVVGVSTRPARGESLLLDRVTSNPGAPGGAVIDPRGRLLGMLGREMRSATTGAWVSHATPSDDLSRVVSNLLAGGARADGSGAAPPSVDLLAVWGFALTPSVGERTPPYIDYVRPGGPADAAGLLADDLLVLWQGRVAATRREALRLAGAHRQAAVTIVVQRGGNLTDVVINSSRQAPAPRTKRAASK